MPEIQTSQPKTGAAAVPLLVREQLAGLVSYDEVEIPVTVEIAEGRRRPVEHIEGAEVNRRVEHRCRRGAGVDDREQSALKGSHDHVEIAVAVQIAERGRRLKADVDAGDDGRRPQDRRRGRAGIGDDGEPAQEIPHDDVEIAVAVEVAERGVEETCGPRRNCRTDCPSRRTRQSSALRCVCWRRCRP